MATSSSSKFSYSYLGLVNIITCGIELCSSAAFCYLPPMLLEAGFSESLMSTVMALGPLCALIFLPIMGTLSDQCKSRYGRRKPFIFALCIGIAISLILLPYSTNIGSFLGVILPEKMTSILILAFSVVLLDFCTQIAYTPIESLLSDPCENEEQHNRSFSVFTFMMSIGGCLGYWVTASDWSSTRLGWYFEGQEHCLFAILLATFLFTSIVSLLIINDPQVVDSSEKLDEVRSIPSNVSISSNGSISSKSETSVKRASPSITVPNNNSIVSTNSIPPNTASKDSLELPQVTQASFMRRPLQTLLLCPCVVAASLLPKMIYEPIMDTIEAMRTMPLSLRRLWVSDFFACTAVMGFRLYFTDYVGEALYHGNPESEPGSAGRIQYEQGIRMATWGLFLHSVTAALYSLVIEKFITAYGTKMTFLFGMGIFTIMTGVMMNVSHVSTTILLCALTGFASATTSTVPYTLLTAYHEKEEVFYPDLDPKHSHLHGKGADIALLDSAYIMSEVISSFVFGIVVAATDSTTSYIVCSFLCGALACYTFLKVKCI
ncbi:solute carrier family 45 member 3-like [Amphiura filiformis]|uniref:solute carrier family 45 member 3-like n=1 Tax=Amphiura filiformis TaxID=82378 RepID=UPI003B2173C3